MGSWRRIRSDLGLHDGVFEEVRIILFVLFGGKVAAEVQLQRFGDVLDAISYVVYGRVGTVYRG